MKDQTGPAFALAGMIVGVAFVAAAPASATHQSCDCNRSICSSDLFEKTLTEFSVNQIAGTSSWTYEICNDKNPDDDCGPPPKDLSHVDIVLPGIGECVSETAQISIEQIECDPSCDAVLACQPVSERDPSCPEFLCEAGTGVFRCETGPKQGELCSGRRECCTPPSASCPHRCEKTPCQDVTTPHPLKVLKCDVAGGHNLDPGECVKVKVTIAGEQPTLGQGTIDEVSKAGRDCVSDAICGPACNCAPVGDECLTRSAGFWGNHPHIADDFFSPNNPLVVCGQNLTTTAAGSCSSATEALCVSPGFEANKKLDRNPPYAALVRQLAAAKLNLRATAANNGSCGSAIAARIGQCEALCGASKSIISNSGCIADLDAFNNSQDTFAMTPSPFDAPGPADPSQCKAANGNCVVVSKHCTVCP